MADLDHPHIGGFVLTALYTQSPTTTTHLAIERSTRRHALVTLLTPNAPEEPRLLFALRARALARLDTSHLPEVLARGQDTLHHDGLTERRDLFITSHPDGPPLHHISSARLPLHARRWLLDATSALGALHSAGFAHRALTPTALTLDPTSDRLVLSSNPALLQRLRPPPPPPEGYPTPPPQDHVRDDLRALCRLFLGVLSDRRTPLRAVLSVCVHDPPADAQALRRLLTSPDTHHHPRIPRIPARWRRAASTTLFAALLACAAVALALWIAALYRDASHHTLASRAAQEQERRLNRATLRLYSAHPQSTLTLRRADGEAVASQRLDGLDAVWRVRPDPGDYTLDATAPGFLPHRQRLSLPPQSRRSLLLSLHTPAGAAQQLVGGMRLIPAGPFWMGCNDAVDDRCQDDEHPGRLQHLDAFLIDHTEVTVAAYSVCIEDGACSAPTHHSAHALYNWGAPDREHHPVNGVDWVQARDHCRWLGKRLPTEAEWEKAARGDDGRELPWLREPASCALAVMRDADDAPGCGQGHTAPVGSRPDGASPHGLVDMAGNLWEWTTTGRDPASGELTDDPLHDNTGLKRVVRGGGFDDPAQHLRASNRGFAAAAAATSDLGFRCARDLPR